MVLHLIVDNLKVFTLNNSYLPELTEGIFNNKIGLNSIHNLDIEQFDTS